MNWRGLKNLTHVQIGVFLALLVFAAMPDFGLKYSLRPHAAAALLVLLGIWLVWKQRAALFDAPAARRLTMVFGLLIIGFLVFEPHGLAEVWRRIRRFFHLWPFRN